MSNNVSYKDLFTQKNYLKLTIANTISRFGDSIVSLAFIWLMYELTGSAALMAVNLLVRSIPDVVFQPITGAIVDKLSKKKILLLCKIGRFVVMLSMALLVTFDMATVTALLAFTFLCSTIEAMRNPADIAATPLVLDEDKYSTGAGLKTSLGQVADLAGTAIAGIVVIIIGSSGALIAGASTFLIAFLVILTLRTNEAKASDKISLTSTKQSIIEGISYIKTNHIFGALLVLGMLLNAMIVPFSAFSVVFITDYLYSGPGFFSLVKIALSIAAVAGAIITPKIKSVSNKPLIMASGLTMGVCLSLMCLLPEISSIALRQGFMILIFVFGGIALGAINVVFGVVFMQQMDKKFLGRMEGLATSAISIATPIVSALCAVIALSVSVPNIFLAFGIALVVAFIILSRFKIYNQI